MVEIESVLKEIQPAVRIEESSFMIDSKIWKEGLHGIKKHQRCRTKIEEIDSKDS